jgi:hypothetical protein
MVDNPVVIPISASGIPEADALTGNDLIFALQGGAFKKIAATRFKGETGDKGDPANPKPLTFTGAVNETYDGSAAKTVSIPTALKSPAALTFTGGATGSYDGGTAKTVAIPERPRIFMGSTPPASGFKDGDIFIKL